MTPATFRSSIFLGCALVFFAAPRAAFPDDNGTWIPVAPPGGRSNACAVLDAPRHRLLVHGGSDGGPRADLWSLDLDSSTWILLETGTGPSARFKHTLTYDTTRERWILFGGTDSSPFIPSPTLSSEVWTLSQEADPAWTQVLPQGTGPSARAGHTAVYDSIRDRLLVFGGRDSVRRNDVWSLDLSGAPVWSQLTPAGTPPAPREQHVAMFDAARDRMLVFGGTTGTPNGEVWSLDFSGVPTWSLLAPGGTAPGARFGPAAAYDAPRDRWVVFGGSTGSVLHEDVWALSLAAATSWTQIIPSGEIPSHRLSHTAIFDPIEETLVVWGGAAGALELPKDARKLSLATTPVWSEMPAPLTPPGPVAHASVYDPVRERVLVHGGIGGDDDVWALSSSGVPAWSPLNASGTPPSPRSDHVAIYDPLRDRLILFGGGFTNETWELVLSGSPAWSLLATSGAPPSGRDGHGAILDPLRDRLVVFGGHTGFAFLDEVWALSLSTLEWTELHPSGPGPIPRRDIVAVHDASRDRMLVYGGYTGDIFINDVWALDLGPSPSWTEILPEGPLPVGPLTHAGIFDAARDRLVAFGGTYTNETWALSFEPVPAWTQLEPSGLLPTGRVDHTAVYNTHQGRMVIFSGHSGLTTLGDAWMLDWGPPVTAVPEIRDARLLSAYPNPATAGATIRFTLDQPGSAVLSVLDLQGRLVRRLVEGALPAGEHAVRWDLKTDQGRTVAAGAYVYEFRAGASRVTARALVLR